MPNADPDILQNPDRLQRLRQLGLLESPPDPVLVRLARLARQLLATPSAMVTLIEGEHQFNQAVAGLPEHADRSVALASSFCQHVIARREPLLVMDTRIEPLFAGNPATALHVAYLGVPLILHDGTAIGTLCVGDVRVRQWKDEELRILEDLAAAVLAQIELRGELQMRQQADIQLKQRVAELEMLRRIERELSDSLEVNSVIQIALDAAARASNAENVALLTLESETLTVMGSIGRYAIGATTTIHQGVLGRAMRTETPILVTDVNDDPDYRPNIADTRAQMSIPLHYRDRTIGALHLETSRPERFRQESFEFLRLIASRIAAALDNALLYQLTSHQLEELRALYSRLSDLEQLNSDMIRIAAHDLRNPLNTIIGYIYLMIEDRANLSPNQRELLHIMRDSAYRINRITQDILSLERIEAMAVSGQYQPVNLTPLVQRAHQALEQRARLRRQTYTLDLTDEPCYVQGDDAQLNEAIDNLLSNAIKYTPEGGVIHVRLFVNEGDEAVFEVQDNGYGIPLEQQKRLFQPFFRAVMEQTSDIEGTGLGLHLVRNIVQRHRGRMRFESAPGTGSTFAFELRLIAPPESDSPPDAPPQPIDTAL